MEDIRKGVCPLCRHNEILLTRPTELTGELNHPVPLTAARLVVPRKGFLGITTYDPHEAGTLSAFICRRCGCTQFFTVRPDEIPTDGATIQMIKGPEPAGPYR